MLDPPSIDCGLQERPLGMLDPSVCKAAGSCHMERHSGYGAPLSSMANFDQSDVEFSGSEAMERPQGMLDPPSSQRLAAVACVTARQAIR